ncbi:MAG TPA: prepilin-type N-terminal cleavage/methylation domain-containing protein [Tepidisphaeraceae bacterium]|jgi:prepilin-type processing-associated H-X9-DG protein|nr:prepilin-type N-terminal cleavage/methylation domain-containing protein [Tepidisphaeraceae bacterium]
MEPKHHRYSAFTLVELLVVIGIIALLISILLPALKKAQQSAQSVACASNMRQVGMAMIMYSSEHKSRFPSARWNAGADSDVPLSSYFEKISRYMGIPDGEVGEAPKLRAKGAQICPSMEPLMLRANSYGLNRHIDKRLYKQSRNLWDYKVSIRRPTSEVILVAEMNFNSDFSTPSPIPSYPPPNLNEGPVEFRHMKGANYLWVDGHVEWVRDRIPANSLSWVWF